MHHFLVLISRRCQHADALTDPGLEKENYDHLPPGEKRFQFPVQLCRGTPQGPSTCISPIPLQTGHLANLRTVPASCMRDKGPA